MDKKKLLITSKKAINAGTTTVYVVLIPVTSPLFNEAGELDKAEVLKKLSTRVGVELTEKTHNISVSDIVHVHNIENLL